MSAETDTQEVISVSMKLTQEDMNNIAFIAEHFDSHNKTVAVSQALDLTRTLLKEMAKGQKLLLENHDGSLQRIIFNSN